MAKDEGLHVLASELARLEELLERHHESLEGRLRGTAALTGLATIALGFAADSPLTSLVTAPGGLVQNALVVTYGFVVAFGLLATGLGLRFSDYRLEPDPYKSWPVLADKTEAGVDYLLVKKRSEAFPINHALVQRKARWAARAVIAFVIQIALLTTLLGTQTVSRWFQ